MNESWRWCRDCAQSTVRCLRHNVHVETIPAILIPIETTLFPAITITVTEIIPPILVP